MPTASSIIEALHRRLRLSLRRDSPSPGEFPVGWQSWFDAMNPRVGRVSGATSESIVAVLTQRPLVSPPRRVGDLNRWQAFATLWRQQWHPPERDERWLRLFAALVSAAWHLFFGALLLWLMYLQYLVAPPRPAGETTVTVEYRGVGTPEAPGGGTQAPTQETPSPSPAPPKPASDAKAVATPAPPTPPPPQLTVDTPAPSLEASIPDVTERDVPEPQMPPPPVEQPVTVSKAVPSDEPAIFVLPPTRRSVEPTLRAPELSAPTRVRTVDVPEPVRPPQRDLPQRELSVAAPVVKTPAAEVAVREIPVQVRAEPVRELPAQPLATPELSRTPTDVRVAEIPMPAAPAAAPTAAASSPTSTSTPPATPGATAPSAPAATAAPAPASPSTAPSGTSAAGPQRPAASAGAGPKPTAAPGSWTAPKRADEWGKSLRDRPGDTPGTAPGLYNRDGSVRLADVPGSASPGMPPGTITEEIKDLDRSGTWLRRKPTDYEPTMFDKYWQPSETLLAEWVRRSVKQVMIPIPGTGKRIQCSVVLLMAGGACGISDSNLNEQPAVARPPPDIPFKPHLQEDNGSVRPPPAPPGG